MRTITDYVVCWVDSDKKQHSVYTHSLEQALLTKFQARKAGYKAKAKMRTETTVTKTIYKRI